MFHNEQRDGNTVPNICPGILTLVTQLSLGLFSKLRGAHTGLEFDAFRQMPNRAAATKATCAGPTQAAAVSLRAHLKPLEDTGTPFLVKVKASYLWIL